MTKFEFQVKADSRQDLTNMIDIALIGIRARITSGEYEVTIRRLSKQELDKQAEEALQEKARDRATCNISGHMPNALGRCTRCGETVQQP